MYIVYNWRQLTECHHSIVHGLVTDHFTLKRLLDGAMCHLLIFAENSAQLCKAVGAENGVKLSLILGKVHLVQLLQLKKYKTVKFKVS